MNQTLSTKISPTGWQFDLNGILVQYVPAASLVCVNKSVKHILHSNLTMLNDVGSARWSVTRLITQDIEIS